MKVKLANRCKYTLAELADYAASRKERADRIKETREQERKERRCPYCRHTEDKETFYKVKADAIRKRTTVRTTCKNCHLTWTSYDARVYLSTFGSYICP